MGRPRSVRGFARLIQPEIVSCPNCEPYDKEDDETIWAVGDESSLEDVFENYEVPEKFRDELAAELSCPGCGSNFERWQDVGLEPESAKTARRRWEEWADLRPRLEEFGTHLEHFPYLGLAHEVGRAIFESVPTFPSTVVGNRVWYRARPIKSGKRLVEAEMGPPPAEKVWSEGRFNHFGQRVFYLASSPVGALMETLDVRNGERLGWVQEFRVDPDFRVLNLETDHWAAEDERLPLLALGLINEHLPSLQPNYSLPWRPEYFVPRFIADCARQHGFRGVLYQASKHYGSNLVLFQWTDGEVTPSGEPALREISPREAVDYGLELPDTLPAMRLPGDLDWGDDLPF